MLRVARRRAGRDYHRGVTPTRPHEYAPWVRITGIVLTALVVCVAAVFLGRWQFHRYEVRAEALHQYNLGLDVEAQALGDLIPAGATELPANTQWREAVLVGYFDPDSTTVLRNRPVDGTPSWQLLAWFDTTDGRSMLVNLGWIPLPGPTADPALPQYPTTETTITVITRSWEDDDGRRGEGATRITPEQVGAPNGEPVPGYGMLREVCADGTCTDVVTGEQTPLPSLSTGPHLSYAWQWWVLAALAPVGAVIMLRRERDDGDDDPTDTPATQPTAASAPLPPRKGRKRRLSDEEIEDAL